MIPRSPLAAHPCFVRRLLGGLAIVLLCSACAQLGKEEAPKSAPQESPPAASTTTSGDGLDKAQQELASGIASYENGTYKLAARQLQSALALGLTDPVSRARAHKYLAFMHCVGGRQRQCREEFSKAFDADPAFDLTPAEAGHPTWGPVFRKLKATRKPTTK
jgi:Tfp pilus assembly protein PilF